MLETKSSKFLVVISIVFILISLSIGYYSFLEWDEGSFLLNARNIYGEGVNFEPSRPMLISILVSLLWEVTGESVFGARLISTAFGLASLFVFYLICRKKFDEPLLPTAVFGLSPLFFFWSSQVMTDVPGLLFILLSYYLYTEERDLLVGISMGLAVTFRYTYAIFALPFLVSYMMDRSEKTGLLKYASGGILGSLPFFAFSYLWYGGLFDKAVLYTTNVAEWSGSGLFASTVPNFEKLFHVSVAFLPGILIGWKDSKLVEKLMVTIHPILTVLFIGMSFYRYWLPITPFLIVIAYQKVDKKKFMAMSIVFVAITGFYVHSEYQERIYCNEEFMEGLEFLSEREGGVISDRWSIAGYKLDQKVSSPYKDYEEFKDENMEYIFTDRDLDYPVVETFQGETCAYIVYRLE